MLIIKTLIELFDECQIENVISSINFLPEKIIFVGFKPLMSNRRVSALNKFFALRKMDIILEFEFVERYDYRNIEDTLLRITDENADCYFDLTGGKELVLAAMGHVSAMKNIPMLQFNPNTGNLIKVKGCDELCDITEESKAQMSVEECITLNGGCIVYDKEPGFSWDLNEDFKRDIRTIWNICKRNCGLWNRQSNFFANCELFGTIDESLKLSVNLTQMKSSRFDIITNKRIIDDLQKYELISEYEISEENLSFRYKNNQVYRCISKAGNILELFVYMCAGQINEENERYFHDIDIGIFVDWDGIIHDGSTPVVDTQNEIDVLLMRNAIPVFISCKNGEVRKEALYELSAVAQRLGGEHAKKVLVASYMCMDPDKRDYLIQRAMDMGIEIIDDVDEMSEDDLMKELKKRIK